MPAAPPARPSSTPGCFEINDFQHLAGQVADDPFFNVNPQKVVPTGGSYGGGFAWMALTDPKWTSPGGKDMKLAVSAPRYGWTDIVYSLIPNGHHSQYPDDLPAFDGSDSSSPFGIPKQSIVSILYGTGQFGATFTPTVDLAFRCLFAPEPFETAPECQDPIDNILPEFLSERSAYYQNQWFARIASDPSYRIPVFNAGTLTDPLFPPVENLRMSNRIQATVPGYPIQQYFGDYQHFVQNKAKEWGDLCGADHHVCTIADYPGGDVNATPAGLYRTGVTTRLNRFVDHFTQPAGNPSQPQPSYNVTTALQICPQNASAEFPANEPGPTFTAGRFSQLAPHRLRVDIGGTQTTTNDVEPNPHASQADPLTNVFINGGRCPVHTAPAGPGVAVYDSQPLAERATMIGATRLTVDYAASTAQGVQLNARLYDIFPDGTQVMVDRGPYRVVSATGPATFELHGNAWRFEQGHSVATRAEPGRLALPEDLRGALDDRGQRREASHPRARAAAARSGGLQERVQVLQGGPGLPRGRGVPAEVRRQQEWCQRARQVRLAQQLSQRKIQLLVLASERRRREAEDFRWRRSRLDIDEEVG